LKQFRYVNGGLFAERLAPADFDAKMRQTLIDCANFDWNTISPAIFGAMFQGVMDKNQRREMGAHYTSEENILKLINPLFLDDLWKEFDRVKTDPNALERFHTKLGQLKFLDPACGCGNFLIVTYRELRNLELEVLKMKLNRAVYTQFQIDENPLEQEIYVNVNQFFGIEYEEFPCQIAQVGMWLMDHQMNNVVADYFGIPFVRLPLTQSATIAHGNALRIDWEDVVPKGELSFILGNPPFVGKKEQSKEQKADLVFVFDNAKVGNLDYVCSWYKKACDYIKGTYIRCAFVSTNSISQGEQPTLLWKPLIDDGAFINFGIPTFKWSNEAKGKAAVHCVIIGFSRIRTAPIINQYLLQAPLVFIESRNKPLCDIPQINYGSIPIDNGALILTSDEYNALNEHDKKLCRKYIGGDEILNNNMRYCLWLISTAPQQIRSSRFALERITKCREFRLSSSRPQTVALAETPHLFGEIRQPDSDMLVIPKVSSENRKYIPISYISPECIVNGSALVVPNATMYHFGILTSNVHNAWMRTVCGRLEMRYQYSNSVVYNNFPWPDANDAQKAEIETLSQAVLEVRALFPDSSLADLYDTRMPQPELLNAHRNLDLAVMKLYGMTTQNTPTEADCVARLMELYQRLVEDN